MAGPNQRPLVLLIHGAWHTPAHYRTFLDAVEAAGYQTAAPELVSSGAGATAGNPAEADVGLITRFARELIDGDDGEAREVMVVAHSYGGIIAQAALAGLGVRTRRALGLKGGVTRIFLVAALVLAVGQTIESVAPSETAGWCRYEVVLPRCPPDCRCKGILLTDITTTTRGDLKTFSPDVDMGALFYPDIPRAEQQKWLAMCKDHPKACSFYTPPSPSSFADIDTVYIFCEEDVLLPVAIQRAMVGALKNSGEEPAGGGGGAAAGRGHAAGRPLSRR